MRALGLITRISPIAQGERPQIGLWITRISAQLKARHPYGLLSFARGPLSGDNPRCSYLQSYSSAQSLAP
jgi:hypothetical protein